jgi:hypothetical protein
MGSVILLVKSKWKVWYSNLLVPYEHYVPIKEDLSDIIDQIKWCRNNDEKCKEISENAKQFAETYLSKNGILDYLQKLLLEIKNVNGVYMYNTISPLTIQYNLQRKILKTMVHKEDVDLSNVSISNFKNSSEYFNAINWIVDVAITKDKIKELLTNEKQIFKNKISVVSEVEFKGISLIKKSQSKTNIQTLTHELFVGKVLNKYVDLPNFAYIFNTYQEGENINLLQQNISDGISLLQYIKSYFNFETYLGILVQIALTLQIAQDKCGFVHNDLSPWNIILKKYTQPVSIQYNIGYNKVYVIKSNIIPVIIDCEKSHVIYKGLHYGKNNMFFTSTIQDIISILSTTIYEISQLENIDVDKLINLSNFITNTRYRKEPFQRRNCIGDIRHFFGRTKKFSELISSEKYELETYKPLDFVDYIVNYVSPLKNILYVSSEYNALLKSNTRQIFNFYLSDNINLRLKSFTDFFDRIRCSF